MHFPRFRNIRNLPARRLALIGLLLGMVCSNTTPVFSKVLLSRGWTPVSLYFLTVLVMTIFLAVHEFIEMEETGRWGMTREDIKGTLLTTLTGGVISPLMFFSGLAYVEASESVLLTSLLPLFVVVFAVLFLGEKFSSSSLLGGSFLLLGLLVMLWPNVQAAELSWGAPLLIGSSISGAMTTIFHKKYVKHRKLDSIVLVRSAISLVITSLWMLLTEPQSFQLLIADHNVWLVIGLPVVGFLMPYFFYFQALNHVKAMEAGFLSIGGPVAGVLIAAVFLGERIDVYQFVSLSLITFGILNINVPLTRWRIVPSRPLELGPLRK